MRCHRYGDGALITPACPGLELIAANHRRWPRRPFAERGTKRVRSHCCRSTVHAELHFSSESKCHVFVVVHFRFTSTVTIGNVMAKSRKSVVDRIAMLL
jgi:hypothetical protein